MAIIPTFKLYNSSDVYIMTLPAVFYTNAPQTIKKYTEVSGIRGTGSIIIPGSDDNWNIIIKGVLNGDNYEEIVTVMDNLESNFVALTPYYIKLDKSAITQYSYKVKRLVPIEYPESLRTNFQEYMITARVNAW